MLLDISKNSIILNLSSKLKPRQLSQLYFLGFEKTTEKDTYEFITPDVNSALLKLIRYLKKEDIKYLLSEACENHLNILQQSINNFELIKAQCRSYKNGVVDHGKFREFVTFVKKNIPRRLRRHQLKAAFHLYLAENGANFSVPGSGKTAVVLSVYEKLRSEGRVNLLFVVGPPSCFYPWRTEFYLTFNRLPNYKILSGGERNLRIEEYYNVKIEKELYLTTYHTFLNDHKEVLKFLDQKGIKAFLVIDEAHYMKQIGGKWASAILRISSHARYRCILTGTPMPKSYSDIFNLFDFLWPTQSPLDSKTKIVIQIREKEGKENLVKTVLDDSIGPLFYRVRKSELSLLPPIFHPPIILPMNKYERKIFDAIKNKINDYSKNDYLKNINVVIQLRRGRMIRLRQATSYSKLLSKALENYSENITGTESEIKRIILNYDNLEMPAKLEYLKEFIKNMQQQKQKIIIWANFIGTLELIVKHLTKVGFYCKLIYGKTPFEKELVKNEIKEEETREKIRGEFIDRNSGLDILVANPAACAESISLHKTCFHALYYDLSYNCAQYIQSLDRIHRVGGSETKTANYYFLQYEDTIDQDIKNSLDEKTKRMSSLIDQDYNVYSLNMFEEDDEIQAYQRIFVK